MYIRLVLERKVMKFLEIIDLKKEKNNELIKLEFKMEKCKNIYRSPQFTDLSIQQGNGNSVEDRLYSYSEYLKQYQNIKKEINEYDKLILRFIKTLQNSEDRLILDLFYIENISLHKIAEKLNYSYSFTRQRKSRAVNFLKKLEF